MVHQSYLLCRKHGIQNRIFMLERTLRVAYSIHSHSPIRWGASDMCRACSRSQSWLVSDPALSPGLLAPCPGLLLLHQLTLFHCTLCFIEQQSKSGGQYLLVYYLTLSCRTWILAYTWVPTEGQGWLNSCSFHSLVNIYGALTLCQALLIQQWTWQSWSCLHKSFLHVGRGERKQEQIKLPNTEISDLEETNKVAVVENRKGTYLK